MITVERIGKKYKLPIDGYRISRIEYSRWYTFFLNSDNDRDTYTLEITRDFCLKSGDDNIDIKTKTKLPHHLVENLEGLCIESAISTKYGELEVKFDNGMVINVDDGPYENWHCKISGTSCHVIGGAGQIVWFN